jgi:hypothetical protein
MIYYYYYQLQERFEETLFNGICKSRLVTKELKEVSAHHHSDENGDSCYSVWTEESSESFVETSFNDVRRSIVGRRLSVVETFI